MNGLDCTFRGAVVLDSAGIKRGVDLIRGRCGHWLERDVASMGTPDCVGAVCYLSYVFCLNFIAVVA